MALAITDVTIEPGLNPIAITAAGTLAVSDTATASIDSKTPTVGQKTMAASSPVVLSSDQSAIPVTVNIATTSTITRVATSTTNVMLSPSDGTKRRVIIFNENGNPLFVKLGATATTTSYTYQMTTKSTLEVDNFSGEIDAILGAGSSFAQVTELR